MPAKAENEYTDFFAGFSIGEKNANFVEIVTNKITK